MPKIDLAAVPERHGTGYPPPFDALAKGRHRKRIGDAGGLTQFGVNICRLEPGAASSQRHWEHTEDELVYVLAGEVVLVEDAGETVLKAGDAAAFKGGVPNGHHLVNRSAHEATVLEIGSRHPDGGADYPDIDLRALTESGVARYVRKDGTPR